MIPHRRAALLGFAALGAAPLAACAGAGRAPEPLAEPAFDPQAWFAGRTDAYGLFEALGRARFGFRTWLEGAPTPDGFTLRERFLYDTGERWERTWRFARAGGGAWTARAENTPEPGTLRAQGSAARMVYVADMPSGGKLTRLRFDMRLNRVGPLVQNRSDVFAFGLKIGRLTMTFVKPDAGTADADAIGAMAPFPVPHAR